MARWSNWQRGGRRHLCRRDPERNGRPQCVDPGRGRIESRIGVNLGEIVIDGADIFGDRVNVAARLEVQAPRGGVLISDLVNAQVKGKIDATFVDVGEVSLKNVDQPLRVWRWGEVEAAAVPGPTIPLPALTQGIASRPLVEFLRHTAAHRTLLKVADPREAVFSPAYELQDSIEHPARLRAQSGRRWANWSRPNWSV
jgi:hypothetical protein